MTLQILADQLSQTSIVFYNQDMDKRLIFHRRLSDTLQQGYSSTNFICSAAYSVMSIEKCRK